MADPAFQPTDAMVESLNFLHRSAGENAMATLWPHVLAELMRLLEGYNHGQDDHERHHPGVIAAWLCGTEDDHA